MALVNPEYLETKAYTAMRDRLALAHGGAIQAGVWNAGDFKVTQRALGANMSVDVAAGFALVNATDPGNLGLYHVQNDATVNVPFVATEGNPRIDQVVLTVNDSTDGGDASDTPVLQVIKGTAISGVTLDAPGASKGAIPNSSLLLADVLVPANSDATGVITANVRDRRPWARGFKFKLGPTTTSYTPAQATWGNLFPAPGIRAELSPGNAVEMTPQLKGWSHNGGGMVRDVLSFWLDGAVTAIPPGSGYIREGLDSGLGAGPLFADGITAGSHTFNLAVYMEGIAGMISVGSYAWVREIIQPVGNNN